MVVLQPCCKFRNAINGWGAAGTNLNDLFSLNARELSWFNLGEGAAGALPSCRFGMGLAVTRSHVFVFGGRNGTWGYDAGESPGVR
jgi:hypothetical protein